MENVLIIAAHPDDEVLGCGGTIAKYTKEGLKVSVLFLTDGESSRNDIENVNSLILKRKNNAKAALKILGCQSISFLDFPDNRLDSIDLLDVVKKVEKYINTIKPFRVITHFVHDLNIDHQITHKAVVTACRPQPENFVRELLFFEVLSSTDWAFEKYFEPNLFVDISSTIDLKIDALDCYHEELRDFPHPRSLKAIKSLAFYRGSMSGLFAAEAFKIGRKLA
jgi:N-acetylglucosamine malate deacetylase 1